MLLAIDVGNTQTVFGLFDGDVLTEQFRVGTNRTQTGDELGVMLRAFVEFERLDGIVLTSSVPQLVREYEAFAERWAGVDLLVLGPGVSTGMTIRYDDPREVGPDRIANAVAARARHGAPAVVVDFGTSTNFDVVSAAGEFAGGVLAPGIEVSMDALFARAARLPKVPFVAPERVISQTTTAALQSGLVYGFAGQVDAIVNRIRAELNAPDAPVIATGGLADLIAPHSETITAVDPELTLQGLRLVWERNNPPRLAAAVDRDRHRVEQHVVVGIGQLRLEQGQDVGSARRSGEQPQLDLGDRRQRHQLLLERSREAPAAQVPRVELLQETGRAMLAQLPDRLADEEQQFRHDLLAARLARVAHDLAQRPRVPLRGSSDHHSRSARSRKDGLCPRTRGDVT